MKDDGKGRIALAKTKGDKKISDGLEAIVRTWAEIQKVLIDAKLATEQDHITWDPEKERFFIKQRQGPMRLAFTVLGK